MELRPYQVEAITRIVERGNLLLAMTMGSGKTATAVRGVRSLRRLREVDRGAVFCLKSIKWQWAREISKWDPRASVQVVDGSKPQRSYAIRHADQFHYTILHYACLIHDWDLIKEHLPIDFVILDEATAIKSHRAKTSKRAKVLGKHTDVRLALSGQPVENRPEELHSIMQFVDADVLGPFPKFDRAFITRDHWGRPVRYKNLDVLNRRMDDAMFRRSREDIKEWLPERIEIEVPIVLEPAVMKLHDHVRADLSDAINAAIGMGIGGSTFDVMNHYGATPDDERMGMMGQVMSRLLAMRMLSAHPHLLRLSADEFDSPLSRRGSEYASALQSTGLLDNLPFGTDKLNALVEMVGEILSEDPRHKVVVFSYFKPMLAIIKSALWKAHSYRSVLLTGDVTGLQRDRAIQAFNTDADVRIFLSSDAGAYGVDLNQGSHLICYDLPWSAGALAQRVARIDRTNSAFDQIQISYLYGQGTIEERMYRMLAQKMKIARAFLDGDFDGKTGGIRLDLESLREFLDS
jgi:SNF2 family DNA or RNA helicase